MPILSVNARWAQNGVSVAGGNGYGGGINQLAYTGGLFVDDNQTVVISDICNNRIVQWKINDMNGTVVAGANGAGKGLNQLEYPNHVLIEKETDSLIICDYGNRRVVRWSRHSSTTQGEILLDDICCSGLAMDNQGYLYVCICEEYQIRRYRIPDKNGTLVAGGNGKGAGLHQLDTPFSIFVDQYQAVYVSDYENHRVMKWSRDATEGIVVAGGQGNGSALSQLSGPAELFVDTLNTLYVTDAWNHRVMRWPQGAKQGTVITGGFGPGAGANQLNVPVALFFDRHGNLYVSDNMNHRVQRFSLE